MASNLWPSVQPLCRREQLLNDPLAGLAWRGTPRENLPEAPVAPDMQ
jgi:hypothetical protein